MRVTIYDKLKKYQITSINIIATVQLKMFAAFFRSYKIWSRTYYQIILSKSLHYNSAGITSCWLLHQVRK